MGRSEVGGQRLPTGVGGGGERGLPHEPNLNRVKFFSTVVLRRWSEVTSLSRIRLKGQATAIQTKKLMRERKRMRRERQRYYPKWHCLLGIYCPPFLAPSDDRPPLSKTAQSQPQPVGPVCSGKRRRAEQPSERGTKVSRASEVSAREGRTRGRTTGGQM